MASSGGPEDRIVGSYASQPPPSPPPGRHRRRLVGVVVAACLVSSVVALLALWSRDGKDCPSVDDLSPQPGLTVFRADMDGDGCETTASWDGRVFEATVSHGEGSPRRYRLGHPDDVVMLGDWDCDRAATPAVYRPATGAVFYFDDWERPEQPLVSAQPLTARRWARPEVRPRKGNCDDVTLFTPDKSGHSASSPVFATCSPSITAVPTRSADGGGGAAPPSARRVARPRRADVSPLAPKRKEKDPDKVAGRVAPGVSVEWRFPAGSEVLASSPGEREVLYLAAHDGSVCAVNARSGEKSWQFDTGSGLRVAPTVAQGAVYVGSTDGNLYALDAATGARRWVARAGPLPTSVKEAGGTLYVGGVDGILHAIDAKTGVTKWKYGTGAPIVASPAAVGTTAFVGSSNGLMHAVNAGRNPWPPFRAGGPIESSPQVAGDRVYFGSNDGRVYGVGLRSGLLMLSANVGSPVRWSPAIAGSTIYFGADSGLFAAISAAGLRQAWSRKGFGAPSTQPAVSEQFVYVGSSNHTLYALDLASGEERWRYATGGPVRSLSLTTEGSVYVGSGDGFLHKLRVGQADAGAEK